MISNTIGKLHDQDWMIVLDRRGNTKVSYSLHTPYESPWAACQTLNKPRTAACKGKVSKMFQWRSRDVSQAQHWGKDKEEPAPSCQ